MRVVILGSGGSTGTPALDVGWGRCDPCNPRNRRTRPSILVEEGETRILVDTPPDLREQLLAAGVRRLSAVVYTHAHADHLHGIDDLRSINRNIGAPLPAYGDPVTLAVLRERFAYAVEPLPARARSFYKPTLDLHDLGDGESFVIGQIPVTAFAQDHGFSTTVGYRFGNVAYTTDVVEMSEAAFAILEGIHTWIIAAPDPLPRGKGAHVGRKGAPTQGHPQPPRQRPGLCHSCGRASFRRRAGVRRLVPRRRKRTKRDQRKLNTGMGRRGLTSIASR